MYHVALTASFFFISLSILDIFGFKSFKALAALGGSDAFQLDTENHNSRSSDFKKSLQTFEHKEEL
jgi:hypothetical protein